jgi:hypothetical protein
MYGMLEEFYYVIITKLCLPDVGSISWIYLS